MQELVVRGKVQGVTWYVSQGAGFIFEGTVEDLSVLC